MGIREKYVSFLDQDSAFRAACLSAFVDMIKQKRCDAFYVRISTAATIDKKRQIVANNKRLMKEMRALHPDKKDWEIKLLLLKQNIRAVSNIGPWDDRWVAHPFPNMGEPEKAMCYLTDIQDYDEDHLAWLYNKASLHAIDRCFMQIRRRMSLLERAIGSSANLGRRWYGYAPYKPVMVERLLDIFGFFTIMLRWGKTSKHQLCGWVWLKDRCLLRILSTIKSKYVVEKNTSKIS